MPRSHATQTVQAASFCPLQTPQTHKDGLSILYLPLEKYNEKKKINTAAHLDKYGTETVGLPQRLRRIAKTLFLFLCIRYKILSLDPNNRQNPLCLSQTRRKYYSRNYLYSSPKNSCNHSIDIQIDNSKTWKEFHYPFEFVRHSLSSNMRLTNDWWLN